ncbi:MAG: hypothetical protein P9M11_01515 [Candidatus Tenebribacter burtonii]|jgi:ATP-dependent DNA helicase RecG|nr:hypothetical protein [Candidatus Tenebribacter burtonii]
MKLIISPDSVNTENSNKTHGTGLIDPANFSPFPKNPTIGKFFKEIGRADELDSCVRNLFKYCNEYTGKFPQLIEGDIFKIIITIPTEVEGLSEGLKSLLNMIEKKSGVQTNNLSKLLEKRPIKTIEHQIKILINKDFIERRGSKKTGGYYLITKMKKIIKNKGREK